MADTAGTTFDELLALHERDVLRVCRSILRDDHASRDAAQETFLRLWHRLVVGDRPAQPAGWLRKVALTCSLDQARKRPRQGGVAADEVEPATTESIVDAAAEAAELERHLEDALDALAEGQRTVFLLRHRGGMRLAEVAALLGVSLPTVKTQFARACTRLQARLAAHRPEGLDR